MSGIWWVPVDERAQRDHMWPSKGTPGSAAWDIKSLLTHEIQPGKAEKIYTGYAIELPVQHCALVLPRSGLACKHGITVANSPGLIDSDYRGEILVYLRNHGTDTFTVEAGTRIAQILIVRVADLISGIGHFGMEMSETARGDGGFGSTGV